jgi:hypoxanthine phosphoribosyltransferase
MAGAAASDRDRKKRKMDREILIERRAILAKVKELADAISSDYAGKEPVFVGVLKGAVFFFSDLIMHLAIPCRIDFIGASSYGSEQCSSGDVKIVKEIGIPVSGRPVIVVEDIVDTGLTLNRIIDGLRQRNPESIRICALIDKKERREQAVHVDYCGFEVKEGFLVGYGLDYNEQFRYLPDIWVLR